MTQISLWDENNEVHTIDVLVFGDARALTALLNSEFPGASIRVRPVNNGVLVSGYVDRPEDVDRIKAPGRGVLSQGADERDRRRRAANPAPPPRL